MNNDLIARLRLFSDDGKHPIADEAADELEAYGRDAERYREIRDMLWGITLTENRQNWDLRISLRAKVDTVEEAVDAAIAAIKESKK